MKNKVFILSIFLLSSFLSSAFSETEAPKNFYEKLQLAINYSSTKQLPQAIALFEELLNANPDDKNIYEKYAAALARNENYEGAIAVLERALKVKGELRHGSTLSIEDNIQRIKQIQLFNQQMKTEPPWEEARRIVFGKADMRTNIPTDYAVSLARDLREMIEKEKKILEEILGPTKNDLDYFKVVVPGRWAEYKEIYKQKFGGAVVAAAVYDEKTKELLIPYSGAGDYFSIAHELTHLLVEDLYGFKPSRFLVEGLAQYVSFKLAKKDGEVEIRECIQLLNSAYDQGILQHAMQLFPAWKSCETSLRGQGCVEFYAHAWSLIAFFIDGKNKKWNDFFQEYLKSERDGIFFSPDSVEKYFKEKLTPADIKDLDDQWLHFVLNLKYENV